ncbi:ATP-binding protein [Acidisphaera sp. L21]|uniref:ATP-binding protein n=1 Tax=Acidisphaera sp. L21 TaxID=1641851 RepID=UPI00131A9E38|nr:ATP-binding protein [Acidisphaera sp. L21]
MIAKLLASLSLTLRQPLYSYCDVETTHGDALVTKHSDYVSIVRVDGMRRMATRDDVARIAMAQRVDLSGSLEGRGHAIVGWFASDPELSAVEINRLNLDSCRAVARELNIDLTDILDERARLWPQIMRWEAAYYVLWSRKGVLTKEERKQMKEEQDALARELPRVGDTQRFYLRSDIMAARHSAFVGRVVASLRNADVASVELDAHAALKVIRESIYRETAGSPWRPSLIGNRVMPRCPEDDEKAQPEHMLWPSIRSQVFYADAITQGGQRVQIGDYEYAPIDMAVGPEDPRPFIELAAALGKDRIPWRGAIVVEGGGKASMAMKEIGASFLAMFPSNGDLRRAFAALRQEREQNNHISVKLRASFATWAPIEDNRKLRRRASTLSQRIEGWGNCRATSVCGDPLEGAMSSVPGLSLSSTGTASLALLGDALSMLPWNRTASPWERGSVLFRRPDGAIWPYDPVGGSMRPLVLDIFVAPPSSGKSVLANTINLGLCLSTAVMGSRGAKLPLIGKADIGPSAQGFVRLVQEALGPERRHEAIFVTMQFGAGYEVNIFDLQVGCQYPLPLERAFLQNFLALATLPPDTSKPFEGINQMISLVVDEAYRLCTDVPGGSPKRYRAGVEPEVDAMLRSQHITLKHEEPWWRDVVDELIAVEEYRLASVAQRHAVPVLQDLINASRTDQVRDMFNKLKIDATHEDSCSLFERYIFDVIRKYPTLNSPTRLDFGPARIIVLDLAAVAPTGSASANRQTEMMYMLARHLLARNFFLHPDYAQYVPETVREYHRIRFQEVMESVKRLDYDEWHRTEGSPQVRAQAELDVREGRKHNIQLGFSSQRLKDMGDGITSQATGRFILRAGDEKEAEEIISRFNLSEASAGVVRYGLHGPGPGGAPFLAVFSADGAKYEQMLVNSLGPIELWALSTTPGDTGVRNRLYDRVGFSEGLRRLAKVFPRGSALKEIERRKAERLTRGELDTKAELGVIDELARELIDGTGMGMKLRDQEFEDAPPMMVAAE